MQKFKFNPSKASTAVFQFSKNETVKTLLQVAGHLYRHAGLTLLNQLGVLDLLRYTKRHSALVLMYHGIIDTRKQPQTNINQVDLQSFDWQIRYLKDHYSVVPLSEIVARIKNSQPVSGLAAITLDDGYRSVLENAAPLLLRYTLPATIFIITGIMGKENLTWYDKVEAQVLSTKTDTISIGGIRYQVRGQTQETIKMLKRRLDALDLDTRDTLLDEISARTGGLDPDAERRYRLMTWNEAEWLRKQGFDFGVHSHSHPHLTRVSPPDLDREIEQPAKLIADCLGMPLGNLIFSYPHGDWNARIRDRVVAAGMLGAVTVRQALVASGSDPFALPRIHVMGDQTNTMFLEAIVELAAWTDKLRTSIYNSLSM